MSLTHTRRIPNRKEIRSFECGRCGIAKDITADADPMFSDKSRWIDSELRPPE